uniref:Uncharacterized protein n=1 Tax=Arundo donax TaxID=35708 RepID=A0A0A9HA75_ARUDO
MQLPIPNHIDLSLQFAVQQVPTFWSRLKNVHINFKCYLGLCFSSYDLCSFYYTPKAPNTISKVTKNSGSVDMI